MANGRVKRRRQQTTARLGFSTPTVTPAGRPGPLGNGGVSRRCCCDSSRGVVDGAAVPLATHPPTRPHHSPPQFPLLLFSLFSAFFFLLASSNTVVPSRRRVRAFNNEIARRGPFCFSPHFAPKAAPSSSPILDPVLSFGADHRSRFAFLFHLLGNGR